MPLLSAKGRRFLLRRSGHGLLLLIVASMLAFTLVSSAPGDFFDEMRINSAISVKTLAALRSQYGLDRPLPVRYLQWILSILKGEWGFSFAYNSPAGPILLSRCKSTLLLTGVATLLAWSIALPLGGWAAMRREKWINWLTTTIIVLLLAIPELVLALLLLMFAARTGYLPVGGLLSADLTDAAGWSSVVDVARHLVLPAVGIAAGALPALLSHVRTAIAEVFDSPFIEAAEGLGIARSRLLLCQAFPAAANPLITLFGSSLGMLISSSLLIEAVFGWPGLGHLMLEAVQQRDFFLVVDGAVLSTAFFLAGSFLADVLLYWVDPRIRVE